MKRLARHFLRLLAADLLAGCQSVPVTGRQQLQLLSEQGDAAMGFNSFREVLNKQNVSRDTRANVWVPSRCWLRAEPPLLLRPLAGAMPTALINTLAC